MHRCLTAIGREKGGSGPRAGRTSGQETIGVESATQAPGRESSFMGSDGRAVVSCEGDLFGGAFPLKITIMDKFTTKSAFVLSDVWHF